MISSKASALLLVMAIIWLSLGPALSMGPTSPNTYYDWPQEKKRSVGYEQFIWDMEAFNFLYGCDYYGMGYPVPAYMPQTADQGVRVGRGGSSGETRQLSSSAEQTRASQVERAPPADAPAALIGKGNSLYILGRYEEALAAYNATTELDPSRAEAWFGQGNALYKLERFEEAAAAYSNAANAKWSHDGP